MNWKGFARCITLIVLITFDVAVIVVLLVMASSYFR